MSALRLARGATGRPKILKFAGCYHGHVDSMLVKAGSGLTEMASPDSAGVPAGTIEDTLVAPLNDLNAVEAIFSEHGSSIAAVIIEPLPANNGLLPQRPEFLRSLAACAREHGALVIFDEVISGFRLAFGGAAEVLGIEPDLVTYGKVIGGGFPVGAYGGRSDLMSQIAPEGPVYQAGTLSGNPVAMSAGLCALKKLLELAPYATLQQRTRQLGESIETIARASTDLPVQVQSEGSLFWTVLGEVSTEDGVVRNPDDIPREHKNHFRNIFHALLEEGFYLAPSAFEVGFMSTVHAPEQLDEFVQAYGRALAELT